MKSKIYVLQKDLPSVKAGARYEYYDKNPESPYYQLMKEDEFMIYNYSKEQGIRYGAVCYLFDAQVVENNPEWFKLLDYNTPIGYTIPSEYLSNIPTIKTTWACKSLNDVLTEGPIMTEEIQWYKKLSAKLNTILEYEDSDTVASQLWLYYRKINNKIKKLELNLEQPTPA